MLSADTLFNYFDELVKEYLQEQRGGVAVLSTRKLVMHLHRHRKDVEHNLLRDALRRFAYKYGLKAEPRRYDMVFHVDVKQLCANMDADSG